jgi:hypothetical protein
MFVVCLFTFCFLWRWWELTKEVFSVKHATTILQDKLSVLYLATPHREDCPSPPTGDLALKKYILFAILYKFCVELKGGGGGINYRLISNHYEKKVQTELANVFTNINKN